MLSLTDEQRALYRLMLVDGIGPVRLRLLLTTFGSAERALAASPAALRQLPGLGSKTIAALREPATDDILDRHLLEFDRLGARLLFANDADYPDGLRSIHAPPAILSIRGNLTADDARAVAIVGSRHCSEYGRRVARQFAFELARHGITVISGLARGIDAAAHRGAIDGGGRTLAVMATGIDRIYPPEHRELADAVASHGALITEAPLFGIPEPGLFPQRNRIISGLSLGVLIVEAAERSGALSTVRHALDQGRDVFAIPGRIGDPSSAGTNKLIKDGATAVTDVDDIVMALSLHPPTPAPVSEGSLFDHSASGNNSKAPEEAPAPRPASVSRVAAEPPRPLSVVEASLWKHLADDPLELDMILERTGLPAAEASTALLMMEMGKFVRRHPGNRYSRA